MTSPILKILKAVKPRPELHSAAETYCKNDMKSGLPTSPFSLKMRLTEGYPVHVPTPLEKNGHEAPILAPPGPSQLLSSPYLGFLSFLPL
ncbi:hypothetical protein MC885_013028, partial [Smutsia gigantea]